jgi:hypothetical protein
MTQEKGKEGRREGGREGGREGWREGGRDLPAKFEEGVRSEGGGDAEGVGIKAQELVHVETKGR